jgi:hypothetical protein
MAWLGALPSAAFAQMGQQQTMSEPFTWGAGGQRVSPEQLALQQQMAQQQMAAGTDYSPVGHWTQGLARASQGVLGGLAMRDARKDAAANAQQGDMIAQALMGGGGDDVVAAALMDPNTPKAVRDFAEMKYRTANRAPPQPGEFERALEASGVAPGTPAWQAAMVKRTANMLDPMASVPLPGGQVYLGPRSGLAEIMGGGDPASTVPGGAPPPPTLPPDFDFDEGGPVATPATFR